MFGLIGKMTSVPGRREELLALLLGHLQDMPGCLSYVVARDPADEQGIWVTEVWDTRESHQASLSLPSVRSLIATARPMIAGFESSTPTELVGGLGL